MKQAFDCGLTRGSWSGIESGREKERSKPVTSNQFRNTKETDLLKKKREKDVDRLQRQNDGRMLQMIM